MNKYTPDLEVMEVIRTIEDIWERVKKIPIRGGIIVILCQDWKHVDYLFKETMRLVEVCPVLGTIEKIKRNHIYFNWGVLVIFITPMWERVAGLEVIGYSNVCYEYTRDVERVSQELDWRSGRHFDWIRDTEE